MKVTGGGASVDVAAVIAVPPKHYQGICAIAEADLMSMTKSFANIGNHLGELGFPHQAAP